MKTMTDRFAWLRARAARLEALTPAEFAHWAQKRRARIVEHHLRNQNSPGYRRHCGAAGRRDLVSDWAHLPFTDKGMLQEWQCARRPATAGPVIFTSTSGTASTAVTVPHTPGSVRAGLGDNFLRALLRGGASLTDRHWGIAHKIATEVSSGSELSMNWLKAVAPDATLVTAAHWPIGAQIATAEDFRPATISSSPGFLLRLALELPPGHRLRPRILLFGGAPLDEPARQHVLNAFKPHRIVGFYPTTDAGALGVSLDGEIYETFSETHWLEIVDDAGHPVAEGEAGTLLVTAYDNYAAPLIRYRVGDQVRHRGWKNNRLLLSDIERQAEAPLGDILLPLADLARWTPRLQAVYPGVIAAQLVRRTTPEGIDQPVIRIITDILPRCLAIAAESLLAEFPVLMHLIQAGDVLPARIEHCQPSAAFKDVFKIPPYTDERALAAHGDRDGMIPI